MGEPSEDRRSPGDYLRSNRNVIEDDQPKKTLFDYPYPTHVNTSSSMNVGRIWMQHPIFKDLSNKV